jgi:uncharacterized protein (TIGR03083 family)
VTAIRSINERLAQIDAGAAYRGVRERVTGLLSDLDPTGWEQRVPHCPEWTIRETLAHLVGVVDDAVHGNLAGAGTNEWTRIQVAKRVGIPGATLLDDWNTYGPFMEGRLSQMGLAAAQGVFDAVTHEHDLRFALGTPGSRESDAVWVAAHFVHTRMASRANIGLILDGFEALPEGSPATVTFIGSAFDAIRIFASRRTEAQIRGLNWSGDPSSVLNATPFGVPTVELTE